MATILAFVRLQFVLHAPSTFCRRQCDIQTKRRQCRRRHRLVDGERRRRRCGRQTRSGDCSHATAVFSKATRFLPLTVRAKCSRLQAPRPFFFADPQLFSAREQRRVFVASVVLFIIYLLLASYIFSVCKFELKLLACRSALKKNIYVKTLFCRL